MKTGPTNGGKKILQRNDLDRWNALKEKYSSDNFGYKKYFDLPTYLERDIKRAIRLRKATPVGGRAVDLGSGTGLFPYCCQQMDIPTLSVQPTFSDKAYSDMFTDTHTFLESLGGTCEGPNVFIHGLTPEKLPPV